MTSSTTTTATLADLPALAQAIADMAHALGDGMTAMHVGPAMTCTEAESVADVLRAAGHLGAAETWLDGHAEESEKEGDADAEDHHHGRHIRGRVIARYNSLLLRALDAGQIDSDELSRRWKAARTRLADVDRYADGTDYTARYEYPGDVAA